MPTRSWILLAALAAFALFIFLNAWWPRSISAERKEAWRRLQHAKRRARRASDPKDQALMWQQAADAALVLGQTHQAATFALNAERAAPKDGAVLASVTSILKKTARYAALEHYLWRRLSLSELGAEEFDHFFNELVALYEGPMRRVGWAKTLRRLHAEKPTATPPSEGV